MRFALIPLLPATLALASCQNVEQALNQAGAAVDIYNSTTGKTLRTAVGSGDVGAAVRDGLKARGEQYKKDPTLLLQDVKQIRRDFQKLLALFKGEVSKEWGKSETKVADRSHYVKYTQNYQSRAIVDFDKGEITIETVDPKTPIGSLKSALVTTLLTPHDPRSVDLFSSKEIELTGEQEPYLLGLVHDQHGKNIDSPQRAEAYAQHLLPAQLQKRVINVNGKKHGAHYVRLKMVSNFSHQQAEKYRPYVEQYAKRFNVSPSLVFSVIRTESNFNPYAVSHIPAYGLMQLVPASGGRDAYRHAKGKDATPGKEYLFDAGNNIELGSAYLDVLNSKYLAAIDHPVSREYCVIAAYNTGAGNVLRAFAPKNQREQAIAEINQLQPPQVYQQLREKLPYEEARRYLAKVTGFRKEFVDLN